MNWARHPAGFGALNRDAYDFVHQEGLDAVCRYLIGRPILKNRQPERRREAEQPGIAHGDTDDAVRRSGHLNHTLHDRFQLFDSFQGNVTPIPYIRPSGKALPLSPRARISSVSSSTHLRKFVPREARLSHPSAAHKQEV